MRSVEVCAEVPLEVTLESAACPLCGTPAGDFVFEAFDRLYGMPGRFRIVRCEKCSLMRTDPRPTRETIGYYYPDDYAPHRYTRVQTDTPRRSRARVLQSIRRAMDPYANALPEIRPGRMLEVGCASGAFLAQMAERGWNVQGIEFAPAAAQLARDAGFEVFAGSIDDAPLAEHDFDLITAWMVIEHLHDPVGALRKLRRSLKPTGLLAFSVPNAASIDFRFRDAGYSLHIPAHLFHFTPETIANVLEAAGWRVERIIHQRTAASLIGSVGNVICDRHPASRIGAHLQALPETGGRIQDILFPAAWLLSMLGQTGRMTVWARPA